MGTSRFQSTFRCLCVIIATSTLVAGCAKIAKLEGQPISTVLQAPSGFQYRRVITHLHTPLSWDACDRKGVVNGVINAGCLEHLRAALCSVHVDAAFITDHPQNMATTEWDALASLEASLETCADGFVPAVSTGMEGNLLALGMEQHATAPADSDRLTFYAEDTRVLRDALAAEAQAIVAIPHTESRTVEHILEIAPDLIEIYNFHANLDPKIRRKSLDAPPFQDLPGILTFLVDPYGTLNPDYMFLHFLERSDLYFQKWGSILAQGQSPFGIAATDAHENVIATKVADGERFDSYRRIMRMASNYVRIADSAPESLKNALKNGRSAVVFEGLGVPLGFDFKATVLRGGVEQAALRSGDQVALQDGDTVHWEIPLPSIYGWSDAEGRSRPHLKIELFHLSTSGSWELIAVSTDQALSFTSALETSSGVSERGFYRAELSIQPLHLAPLIHPFEEQAEKVFPWIYTNWVKLL